MFSCLGFKECGYGMLQHKNDVSNGFVGHGLYAGHMGQ